MCNQLFVKVFLIPVFTSLLFVPAFGQHRTSVSAGIGIPELANIGIRHRINQTRLGLTIGTMPVRDESIFSICGDVFFHVGGKSRYTDLHPWYLQSGLNYLHDETTKVMDNYLYLKLRVGREFNITERIGVDLEGGLLIELSHDSVEKVPSNSWFDLDLDYPVLPALGVSVFYRI